MATYSLDNFLGTPIPGETVLKIYDKTRKLRYEFNPNIAYFFTKSNIVIIRIEDKNDIYLDFLNTLEAATAASKLNDAKKEIVTPVAPTGTGSLSETEQRKLAYFHALSKVMSNDNQQITEPKYKSAHNVNVNELWGSTILPCYTYNDVVAQSLINSAITLHNQVILTKVPDSNGQSWYFNNSGVFVRPWIGPTDVPFPLTNLPSDGFNVILYRGDDATKGVPGSVINPLVGAWTPEYYAGVVHFGLGNTPTDLGWGTIKATFFEYTGIFGVEGATGAFTTAAFNSGTSQLIFNSGTSSESIVDLSSLSGSSASSGSTVIGPADDFGGNYSNGMFDWFVDSTRVGIAVNKFNEMFKLLAPAPPSTDWSGAISSIQITDTKYTSRTIGDGVTRTSSVITSSTPTYTVTDTVGTGSSARSKDGNFVFTIKNWDSSTIDTTTINSGSTGRSGQPITYTIGDPYLSVSGKEGFWTGVTAFNVSGTVPSITPSVSGRTISFEHPTSQTKTSNTFYVDNSSHTPTATGLVVTGNNPIMTRWVSGVPSLVAGVTLTGISFSITNVSSYFYAQTNQVWNITGTRISSVNGDLDSIPQTVGATGTITNVTASISSGYAESIGFTVTPYNRSAVGGTTTSFSSTTSGFPLRIDTVSNESSRLESGSGNYPIPGTYGAVWGANSGVSLLLNNELQMLNGTYIYPTVNYTSFGGFDYSTATGTRWVTFNLGTFNNNNAFTLNFTSTNITSVGQSGLYVEVKIVGATSWVNGNAPYSGSIPNPGSTLTDGDPAVQIGFPSTATLRRIVFGSPTYSGPIVVRIGIAQGSNITLTNLTATSIV